MTATEFLYSNMAMHLAQNGWNITALPSDRTEEFIRLTLQSTLTGSGDTSIGSVTVTMNYSENTKQMTRVKRDLNSVQRDVTDGICPTDQILYTDRKLILPISEKQDAEYGRNIFGEVRVIIELTSKSLSLTDVVSANKEVQDRLTDLANTFPYADNSDFLCWNQNYHKVQPIIAEGKSLKPDLRTVYVTELTSSKLKCISVADHTLYAEQTLVLSQDSEPIYQNKEKILRVPQNSLSLKFQKSEFQKVIEWLEKEHKGITVCNEKDSYPKFKDFTIDIYKFTMTMEFNDEDNFDSCFTGGIMLESTRKTDEGWTGFNEFRPMTAEGVISAVNYILSLPKPTEEKSAG